MRMASMSPARLLGRSARPISTAAQRALLLLPCSCCVPSLREFVPASDVAPLSPRAGPHSFLSLCIDCMADMSDIVLSTGSIEFILRPSLRRASYPPPSDHVSRHRTLDRILLPRSRFTGRAHILLPCSLPHFGFGFGPVIGPCLRTGPFFLLFAPRVEWHLPLDGGGGGAANATPRGSQATKRSRPRYLPAR